MRDSQFHSLGVASRRYCDGDAAEAGRMLRRRGVDGLGERDNVRFCKARRRKKDTNRTEHHKGTQSCQSLMLRSSLRSVAPSVRSGERSHWWSSAATVARAVSMRALGRYDRGGGSRGGGYSGPRSEVDERAVHVGCGVMRSAGGERGGVEKVIRGNAAAGGIRSPS